MIKDYFPLLSSPLFSHAQVFSFLSFSVWLRNWPYNTFSCHSALCSALLRSLKPSADSRLCSSASPFLVAWSNFSLLPRTQLCSEVLACPMQSSTDISPRPPSDLGTYRRATQSFGFSALFIVRIFLVLTSRPFSSFFDQLIIPPVYLTKGTAHVLFPCIKFPPFSLEPATFLTRIRYSLLIFSFIWS